MTPQEERGNEVPAEAAVGPAPRRGKRGARRVRLRRLLFWALLCVVAAVVVLLSSPYWLPTGWLRDRLVAELERALPARVTIGELSFRLGRGIRVRCRDVSVVSEAEGTRLEVSLDTVEGEALLGGLLAGQLEVPELTVASVRCRLQEGPQGVGPLLRRWTGKVREEVRARRPGAPGRPSGRAPRLQLGRLLLSDLVVTLTDREGRLLRRTPRIDAGLKILSTTPLQVRFEAEAGGFVAQGRLTGVSGPQGRTQMLLLIRDADLEAVAEYLRFLVGPASPSLRGSVKEGRFEATASREGLSLQAAATVEHLEAGPFSTTRLQVQDARLTLGRAGSQWNLTLEALPIETGVFNLKVPETTPAAAPWAAGLSLSGRKLSASLAGSARLAEGTLEASLRTARPLQLLEVRLKAAGEPSPLLSAAELEGSLQEAALKWTPGEQPTLSLSGDLRFREVAPEGLLARVPGSLACQPLSGSVQVALKDGSLQAEAALRGGSLSFEEGTLRVAVAPWQAQARLTAGLAEKRLQVTSVGWSSPSVLVRLEPGAGGPLEATFSGVNLEGAGSAEPAEGAWQVSGSAKVDLGPFRLVHGGDEAARVERVSLDGSAAASLAPGPEGGPDGAVALRAAEVSLSVSGAKVEEAVAGLFAGWPRGLGVRLAGEARLAGRFDGRRWRLEAAGTGEEARLRWAGRGAPLHFDLDGVRGSVRAGVSTVGPEVSVEECRVSSPLGEVSWRGLIRRAAGKVELRLAGRLATDWSALAAQWEALTAALPEEVRRTLARFDFQGPLSVEDVVVTGTPEDLTVEAQVDLTRSEVRFDGELLKSAGTRGGMPLRLVVGEEVRLEELALEVGPLPRVRLAGRLDRSLSRGRFELTVDELERVTLREIRPEWDRLALSGGLSVEAVLEGLRETPSARARLHFDRLALELVGAERVRVEVDGTVAVTPAALDCGDLHIIVDGNTLHLKARLDDYLGLVAGLSGPTPTAEPPPAGERLAQLRVELRAERLDLRGLERMLPGPAAEATPAAVVELTPTADPRLAHPRVIPQVAVSREGLEAALSRWLPRLVAGLAAEGSLEVGEVLTEEVTLQDLKAAWSLRDGLVDVEVCEAALAGGRFDAGGSQLRLNRWPPTYRVTYKALDLDPTPFTMELVARRFPGLSYSGKLTDEGTIEGPLSLDLRELLRAQRGHTRTTLTDGTLVGPLPVPEYIRRAFPKLNLSRYRFGTMTNEATIEEGLCRNSMSFNGTMDIYIIGSTDPDGNIDYELGLSLLKSVAGPAGSLTPEVGRLPLMHFTGRVEGTRFAQLQGRYISPPELVAKLLTEGLYRRFKTGVLDMGYLRGLERKFPIPGLDLLVNGLDFVLDITIRLIPGLGKEKPEPQPRKTP